MPKTWRTAAFRVLSLAALQFLGVTAQTTDAVCLPYLGWLSNSQHQSPCVVSSSLLAVCHGGSFNVEALPNGNHYLGPSSVLSATSCECNTVAYTLMSACAACQGRSYLSWSQWTANCPSVSTGFPKPLPTGLYVPGWAYLDPRPSDTFDLLQAKQGANLTESVVLPVPVSTSKPVTPTSTSKSKSSSQHHTSTSEGSTATHVNPSSASGLTNDNHTSSNNHDHMIVGVVVAMSVLGLTFLGFLAWFIQWRRGKKEHWNQVVSPAEVKSPDASQDDLKDDLHVVIEDYDNNLSHRHNV